MSVKEMNKIRLMTIFYVMQEYVCSNSQYYSK